MRRPPRKSWMVKQKIMSSTLELVKSLKAKSVPRHDQNILKMVSHTISTDELDTNFSPSLHQQSYFGVGLVVRRLERCLGLWMLSFQRTRIILRWPGWQRSFLRIDRASPSCFIIQCDVRPLSTGSSLGVERARRTELLEKTCGRGRYLPRQRPLGRGPKRGEEAEGAGRRRRRPI